MIGAKETQNRYLVEFERVFTTPGAAGPAWLQGIREKAVHRFAELDFPTTKQEAWKYTNVSPIASAAFRLAGDDGTSLAQAANLEIEEAARRLLVGLGDGPRLVFVDGRFSKALSSENRFSELQNRGRHGDPPVQGVSLLAGGDNPTVTSYSEAPGSGLKIGSLGELIRAGEAALEGQLGRTADYSDHAFTALNTAFLSDGAFVEIPGGAVIEAPICLVYVSTGAADQQTVSHPRNLIIAQHHSQASIVELYIRLGDGRYFTNAVTEIVAGDGAVISHSKLQQESAGAYHVASLYVRQGRDSSFNSHSITVGGLLVRNDITVVLDGEGAECQLDGLYIENGAQHVDNHTLIDHARPHGSSRENYKGILDGRSTGVFNGSIVVRKDAQKTDARQSNKNLLLSRDAEINTKPQLEILADDVKCSHGATIGHIDQEAIFYMRSRGIDESEARSLMMYAFCNEIIERIKSAEIRELIGKAVFARVAGGQG